MTSEQKSTLKSPSDPSRWVDEYGDILFRYAMFRLGHAQSAEDLVQETFLSALRSRETFAGRSTERTWLLGILKNKIVDRLRQHYRGETIESGLPVDDILDRCFDDTGRWRTPLARHSGNPADALEREEFWTTIDKCLRKLPSRVKAAFSLRELDSLTSEEVQDVLGVSAGNLWTMLHRARVGLAHCLDVNWFQNTTEGE